MTTLQWSNPSNNVFLCIGIYLGLRSNSKITSLLLIYAFNIANTLFLQCTYIPKTYNIMGKAEFEGKFPQVRNLIFKICFIESTYSQWVKWTIFWLSSIEIIITLILNYLNDTKKNASWNDLFSLSIVKYDPDMFLTGFVASVNVETFIMKNNGRPCCPLHNSVRL